MEKRTFGALAAASLTLLLTQSPALAAGKAKAPAKDAKSGGKCVHNCSGYANCKGNGNNSCKGHNDCANTGLVPKECSAKTTPEDCKGVLDAKKNGMCSWFTE